MRLFIVLAVVLVTACGADSSTPSNPTYAPKIKAVRVTGLNQVDETLTGRYVFAQNVPANQDISRQFWLHPNGSKIKQGNQLTLTKDLQGFEIEYCVVPKTTITEYENARICSKKILVKWKPFVYHTRIRIPNAANNRVENPLSAFVDELPDDVKHVCQWYADAKAIDDEVGDIDFHGNSCKSIKLKKAWQGKKIHVCVLKKDNKALVACSAEQVLVKAKYGDKKPVAHIKNLPQTIKTHTQVQLNYDYQDADNDEEDTSKTQYAWFVDDLKVADSKSWLVTPESQNKQLKGCVTVFAKTGHLEGNQQCSKPQTVYKYEETKPVASHLHIKGILAVGQTIEAAYRFYDSNGDTEAATVFAWKIAGETLNGRQLTLKPEWKNKPLTLCITPKDDSPLEGNVTCQEIYWPKLTLKNKTSLTLDGVMQPVLKHYPNFSESWWRIAGRSGLAFTHGRSLQANTPKNWSGSSYNSPPFSTLRAVEFCIKSKNLADNEVTLCTEITRDMGIKQGAIIDKDNPNRVGFDPKRYIQHHRNGKDYYVMRPLTEAEFLLFHSSLRKKYQSIAYDDKENAPKGIAMSPADAQAFCQRTQSLGQIATGEAMRDVFFNKEMSRVWNIDNHETFLVKNDYFTEEKSWLSWFSYDFEHVSLGGSQSGSEGRQQAKDKIIAPIQLDKAYRFSCMSVQKNMSVW